MSRARTLADLLDSSGDVKSANLDNATIPNLSSTASGIDISGDLQVDSGTSSNIIIEKNNTGGASLRFHNEGSQLSYIQLDASEDMIHYGGYGVNQIIYAGGSERMRITSTGNVLLGGVSDVVASANAPHKLHIPDGLTFGGSAYTYASLHGSGGNVVLSANAYPANLGTESTITFKTATSGGGFATDVVIKNGNVEMGGNLDVTGTVAATSYTGDGSSLTGIDALPSQSGQSGKYLTTSSGSASWASLDTDANSTSKGLYEMANTISSNYSIASGNNALTAGPITINSGVSVTIPSGSTWVIA